jgi:hypothetical protein
MRINAAQRDEPKAFTAASGVKAEIAEPTAKSKSKLATFSGNAYTGAVMKPEGWWQNIIVDLSGVRLGSKSRPVLRQHDHNQIVGHTTDVKVTEQGIEIAGVCSGQTEHVAKVVDPAKNGFPWQLSIGANPVRTEYLEAGETATVNGREVSGPLTISRETELGEISFVPLGADGETSATVSASTRKGYTPMYRKMLKAAKANGLKAAQKYADEDIDKMDEKEAKAALKKCMKAEDAPEKKVDADDDEDADKAKAKARAADDDEEDDDEDKKAEAAARKRVQAARTAEANEVRRCEAIRAAGAKQGVTQIEIADDKGAKKKVNLIAHAIEEGWTIEKTELEAMRAARPGASAGGPHFHIVNRPEVNDAVLECAVFQAAGDKFQLFDNEFYRREDNDRGRISPREQKRIQAELNARYPDQVQQAAHTTFKGRIGLQQLLTTIAAANGYRGSEVIRDDGDLASTAHYCMIRADGASTSSLANVLANVLNKNMLQGYLWVDGAWKEVSSIGSVKDFKPTKNINLFGDFEFQDLGASGELKNASIQDQAFSNQASTSGRILTIPRTHIINDDLGALTTVPMLMGRGAGLKLNKAFWTKYMNPGKDDGGSTDFYATTHTITGAVGNANYQSGAGTVLSSTSLNAATVLFDNQVDPQGNPLGIDPEILLYPPNLDNTARELMNSEYIIATALGSTSSADVRPSKNIWQGRYRPVKARYLNKSAFTGNSTTAWYLLANPAVCPVIEVVFLNGQQTPTVQTAGPDFQFNMLGITVRAFFDIGVEKQNFRGGVKSAGA